MRYNLKQWCIENGKTELLEQWDGERNATLIPEQCSAMSNAKVWWKCPKGHSWETSVCVRTSGNSSCPYCSGRYAIQGENDLATTNPLLALEWHPTKNGDLLPHQVKAGTSKKVWWLCRTCGHEWQAMINSRARNGNGCPECGKKKISLSRKTPKDGQSLSEKYPEVASEWNYSRNRELSPKDLPARSSQKVWWLCREGHEWQASISNRVSGRGCPVCGHKRIVEGINDLGTLNSDLAAQRHPSKNGDLTPADVSPSSSKRIWWICERGHEWEATINNRTKRGCPECSKARRVSFPEKAVFFYVKELCSDAVENYKPKWLGGKEIDVFIPSINVGIEYDGEKYHSNADADKEKDELCKDKNVELLRIREPDCPQLEASANIFPLETRKETELEVVIHQVLLYLQGKMSEPRPIPNVNIAFHRGEIYELVGYLEKEHSLAITHPQLAKEWFVEKNGSLTPEIVTQGSDKKVWWICSKRHVWDASISHRVSGKGCPVCSGRKIISGQNDIQTVYPELMKEWDWELNSEISPQTCGKSDTRKVAWKCRICGESWKSSIYSRIKGSGCPACLAKHLSEENSKPLRGHSLAEINPEVAKQWHPLRNGDLTPKNVSAGSHKRVWWLCENGHEWEAVIHSRNSGSGCPMCARKRKNKTGQ